MTAIVRTVEVPTENGRYATIDFRRCRDGAWTVDISDDLIAQAPEALTAALVLAFRDLAPEIESMTCRYCGHPIKGGGGGWWSLRTTFEVCEGDSPTSFHEPDSGSEAPSCD